MPIYYHAQVQVLLEVLNLELAHFVEYRPETTFSAKEFQVTEVYRDRDWFEKHLPLMRSFCDELNNTPEEEIRKLVAMNHSPPRKELVLDFDDNKVSSPNGSSGAEWLGLNDCDT